MDAQNIMTAVSTLGFDLYVWRPFLVYGKAERITPKRKQRNAGSY